VGDFLSVRTNQSSLLFIKIKCKMLACIRIREDTYPRLRIIGIKPPFFSVHRSLPHLQNTTSIDCLIGRSIITLSGKTCSSYLAKAWGPHTRTFFRVGLVVCGVDVLTLPSAAVRLSGLNSQEQTTTSSPCSLRFLTDEGTCWDVCKQYFQPEMCAIPRDVSIHYLLGKDAVDLGVSR
jgi:hypothetical protein